MTYGAPTERAQQAASTEEAYWLANSHYYNPNWGYQNGEKRNSRVVRAFAPTSILTLGLEDRQQRYARDDQFGLHLFVLQRYFARLERQCLRSAPGLL